MFHHLAFLLMAPLASADYILTLFQSSCDSGAAVSVRQGFLPSGGCTSSQGGSTKITCVNASFYYQDIYTTPNCSSSATRMPMATQPCTPGLGGQPALNQSCVEGAFVPPPGSIVQEAVTQTTGCPATASPTYAVAVPTGACIPVSGPSGALQYAEYGTNATSILATLHNASTCSDAPVDSEAFPLGCSAQRPGDAGAAPLQAAWVAAPLAGAPLQLPPAHQRRAAAANETASLTLSPSVTPTLGSTLSPTPNATRVPSATSSRRNASSTNTGTATFSPAPAPAPASQYLIVWSVVPTTPPTPSATAGASPASAPAAASTPSATVVGSAVGGTAAALALLGGAAFYVQRVRAGRDDAFKPLLRSS